MKSKKVCALLLTAAMVADTLVGCGGGDTGSTSTGDSAPAATDSGDSGEAAADTGSDSAASGEDRREVKDHPSRGR